MAYKNDLQQKEYQRKWFQKNKEKIRERTKGFKKEHKSKLALWLVDFKASLSCYVCGESSSCCLHFHHRDPVQKRFTISSAVNIGVCREELLLEIAKCDILCANCHAKLHYSERKTASPISRSPPVSRDS